MLPAELGDKQEAGDIRLSGPRQRVSFPLGLALWCGKIKWESSGCQSGWGVSVSVSQPSGSRTVIRIWVQETLESNRW